MKRRHDGRLTCASISVSGSSSERHDVSAAVVVSVDRSSGSCLIQSDASTAAAAAAAADGFDADPGRESDMEKAGGAAAAAAATAKLGGNDEMKSCCVTTVDGPARNDGRMLSTVAAPVAGD